MKGRGVLGGGLALLVSLMVPFAGAVAADAEGNYAVRGMGAQPCSALVRAAQTGAAEYRLFRDWADGYMTALNRTTDDVFDVMMIQRSDVVVGLLARVCAVETDDIRVETALARLLNRVEPARVAGASELMQISLGETHVLLRQETLIRVQEALAERGLYDGEPSGEFDEATRTALRQFQDNEDIPATRVPDHTTLIRLLVP